MRIERIRINGLAQPMGYQLGQPCVSFQVTDAASTRPAAIRLELWQEGAEQPLYSREDAQIDWTGETLPVQLMPRTAYIVRITVQGEAGDSACAESRFETGKMDEAWRAKWIAPKAGDECHPVLYKSFPVRAGLVSARLYACGVGMFEARVNGRKLGQEYLLPGVTNYEKRLQVITFAVETLHEGENELSFLLGEGWYLGEFGLHRQKYNYGNRKAVIGELYLRYEDGSETVICTDGTFVYQPSQIMASGVYYGEDIDRTFCAQDRQPVEVIEQPQADPGTANLCRLADRLSPPILVHETLPVKEILHTPKGETVLDFGQNFAGFPEFDADLPAGCRVTLDFGETLQHGNFYRENYRAARSQLVYVSSGKKETVRPHFTFFGFRYVRVTGWQGEIKPDSFRGCALYSGMDRTGWIRTGNEKIDRLFENTLWGLRSNFIDMPTDCPQRDERLGWTGDAQIFAPTASYHMDTRAFYHKFEQDLMDEQAFMDGAMPNYVPNFGHQMGSTSAWGDVATLLPMTLWRAYGSKTELAYAYPMMKGWVDWMDRQDTQRRFTFDPPFQFGDWVGLDGPTEYSYKGGTDDHYLGAVYYYQSTKLTADAAQTLGYEADAMHYAQLRDNIRGFILNEYFTPSGRLALDTQAAFVAALKFGLWRDRSKLQQQFREKLQRDGYTLRCGFVGAPMLCTVLAENGMTELAYDFLLEEDFPSWLYSVNLGATTIWERWNSIGEDGVISSTGMNSLNHYSYGSVMEFVYAWAAGIRPAQPGFRRAVIAPQPDVRLPHIACAYDSVAGRYVCETRLHPDGMLDVHVEIPFGCEAEVTLPRSDAKPQTLLAGKYDFHYMPTRDYRYPFDGYTPLSKLGASAQAMEILRRLAPNAAEAAAARKHELGTYGLAELRSKQDSVDEQKLAQAVQELRCVSVPVE